MRPAAARPAGRPRDPELDRAILAAAEQQLREAGYAGMSLESVAAAAGTTVPAVRRRFRGKGRQGEDNCREGAEEQSLAIHPILPHFAIESR